MGEYELWVNFRLIHHKLEEQQDWDYLGFKLDACFEYLYNL